MDEKRREFLTAFAEAIQSLEPDAFEGTSITATLALENVAERGPHDYLLSTPEDVAALESTAEYLGVSDVLNFTCDVGHAADPIEMVHAMGDIENVHLHNHVAVTDSRVADLRERYELPADAPVGEEDTSGRVYHLPPHVGDVDVPSVLNALDDVGYDGPVTVELHRNLRTATVVKETVDAMQTYA